MEIIKIPTYSFKIKSADKRKLIFDFVRKKYIAFTPEELIRQNFIQYLINEKTYSESLISVELPIKVNSLVKRCDIVIYNRKGKPFMIVECKAPTVKINQTVFDQITRYNINFRVDYLVITNGKETFCCRINYEKGSYKFMNYIPAYSEVN